MRKRAQRADPPAASPGAPAPDDEGIDYSDIPDRGGDAAFWAATREGPVVMTERTVEVLREELGQLRGALASVLEVLDPGRTPLAPSGGDGHHLSEVLRRARELLERTAPAPGG